MIHSPSDGETSDISSQQMKNRLEFEKRVLSTSPKNMVTVTEEKEKENSKSTIQQEKSERGEK